MVLPIEFSSKQVSSTDSLIEGLSPRVAMQEYIDSLAPNQSVEISKPSKVQYWDVLMPRSP